MTTVSFSSRLQVYHQLIEGRGTDRVQAGGRLIQEQQSGFERQRARQRGALDHATGELRGILAPASGGSPP